MRAPSLPILSSVFLGALAVLAGCQSHGGPPPPHTIGPPVTADQVRERQTRSEIDLLRDDIARLEERLRVGVPASPAQGVGPAPEDLLRKMEEEKQVQEGHNRLLARRYYEVGSKLYREADYLRAKENLEKALALDPDLREAKGLLDEVGQVLGFRPEEMRTVKDFYEKRLQVLVQQTEVEVQNHVLRGRRAYQQKDYQQAIEEYQAALEKLGAIPYDVGLSPRQEEIAGLLEDAKIRNQEWTKEEEENRRLAAERLADAEERRRVRLRDEKIQRLFKEAVVRFEEKKYTQSEALANQILAIDPQFRYAEDLRQDSVRARHDQAYVKYLDGRIENWKRMIENIAESMIPYADDNPVRYPDEEYWEAVSERAKESTFGGAEEAAEDPDILAVKRKMEATSMALEFDDATLYEIVDFIRSFAQINIEFASDVRKEGIPDERRSFQVRGLPLASVLRLLLDQYGLAYTFEGKVVIITKPELAAGRPELELHDVRDLVRDVPDFPGPSVELSSGGDDGAFGGVGAGFGTTDEPQASFGAEQLVELIRQNIEPASWEGREDVSIDLTGDGQLLVVHTRDVQNDVREFLSRLRTFTGSMVAIESRFLTVHDNFLQDISLEWRGNDNVFLSDAQDQSGEGLETGAYRAKIIRNNAWDMRFRSAYPFFSGLGGATATVAEDFASGGELANEGGLGMQLSLLKEFQWNQVLRAVRKMEKASVLTAPRVTVFNTQRAHISVATQQSYIMDYDVEIAQQAAVYDPIIGTVQDGLVLDVRPIISNDRKYVTIELQPAVATLEALREVDISVPVDQPGDPNYTPIQLPWVFLQRAQATVRMPDRGVLLVAGLKNTVDRDQSGETPFLSKIPLLGALFKREAKLTENRNLLILIRAEIIDLAEREQYRPIPPRG